MKYSKWQRANKVRPAREGIYQWKCKIAQPTIAKTPWIRGRWDIAPFNAPDQRCEHCQWRGVVE